MKRVKQTGKRLILIYPGKTAAKKGKESRTWAMMTQKKVGVILSRENSNKKGQRKQKMGNDDPEKG